MDVSFRCVCPGAPHETDTVTLRDTLDFRSAKSIYNEVGIFKDDQPDATAGEVLAVMSEQYIIFGVESWTLTDADGKPLPVTRPELRNLVETHWDAAMSITDAADELYRPQVLLPLLERATAVSTSSPDTPTTPSTSAPTGSPGKRPKSLKQSSTITSPTDDTGETTESPDGGSNSSRTSASAA